MGCGSTALACKNLGRHYVGIEKRPEYVEVAQARIN
jgi:DNA modification methylase